MRLSLEQIRRASEMLRKYFEPTRLVEVSSLAKSNGARASLKIESDLPTHSFKVRGALVALSARLERGPVKEVIASSTGNHGAAVAYAAKPLNVPATIFLPRNPNPVKRANIEKSGAKIVEHGRDISEAFQAASACGRGEGIYFLNDATDEDLPAGPATIACEIFDQAPDTDAIYVPMGDTALIRSIASAARHLRPQVRIIGVQAERAPAYYLSWKKGEVVTTDSCDTIADGLATRTPEEPNVREILELVDDVRLVSEQQMLDAIRHLWTEEHLVAEPAGAATTAAFLQETQPSAHHTVLILSGANVSEDVWSQATQGYASRGHGTH
jgi:threonine dehydratase